MTAYSGGTLVVLCTMQGLSSAEAFPSGLPIWSQKRTGTTWHPPVLV